MCDFIILWFLIKRTEVSDPRDYVNHFVARAASCNVWQCAKNWRSKQDRLRKTRERDREQETSEEIDAGFVNASPTYPDYFLLIFIGDMWPTNTPSTLAELDGTRLDISIFTGGNIRKTER